MIAAEPSRVYVSLLAIVAVAASMDWVEPLMSTYDPAATLIDTVEAIPLIAAVVCAMMCSY
jgi:hypothetical protein